MRFRHRFSRSTSRNPVERQVGFGRGLLHTLGVSLDDEDRRTRNAVLAAYGVGTSLGLTLPYSRAHELEADKLGLIYMARAGYDPRRSLVFWDKMMRSQRASAVPGFFSTHPA